MINRLKARVLAPLSLGLLLCACGEQPQDPVSEVPETNSVTIAPPQDAILQAPETAPQAAAVPAAAPAAADSGDVETGMFFKPKLDGYTLHNESDDDGDGDGVNETHVRRYINKAGDAVFSMTTGDKLWAWSLDTKAGDDTDIKKNYVIRNSNCDSVFDERYSLNAEFHVPICLTQGGTADKPES